MQPIKQVLILLLVAINLPATSAQSCITNQLWNGGSIIQPSGAINQCLPYPLFSANWTFQANQNDSFTVWGGQNYCNTSYNAAGMQCGGVQSYTGLGTNAVFLSGLF